MNQTDAKQNNSLTLADYIVKLNVGGFRYETTRSTLTSIPNTYFTSLLSGVFPSLKDESSAFFIDRDGHLFQPILSYLRTREITLAKDLNPAAVAREAEFYCISSMVEALQEYIPQPPQQLPSYNDAEGEFRNQLVFSSSTHWENYVSNYLKRYKNDIRRIFQELDEQGFVSGILKVLKVEEDEKPRLTEERYISTAFGQHVPMYHIGTIVFSMKTVSPKVVALLARFFASNGISGRVNPDPPEQTDFPHFDAYQMTLTWHSLQWTNHPINSFEFGLTTHNCSC